jgi:hypothetical protein
LILWQLVNTAGNSRLVNRRWENVPFSSNLAVEMIKRVPRRWTAVAVMGLVAAVVGVVAGVLAHAAGDNVAGAVLAGGAAFAGAGGLLLAVAHYTAEV